MTPVAWMGGTRPAPLLTISREERHLVSKLFREQANLYADYWGMRAATDTLRTFWRRARYDAHATIRVLYRNPTKEQA